MICSDLTMTYVNTILELRILVVYPAVGQMLKKKNSLSVFKPQIILFSQL